MVYEWEYLCSRRIICSRMDWSGLLSVVVVVVSRRMFVETLELVAAEEDVGERQLCGLFIVVPNANLGMYSCVGKWERVSRPKIGKFGQLDTLRWRAWEAEEATLVRLRVAKVRLMRRENAKKG